MKQRLSIILILLLLLPQAIFAFATEGTESIEPDKMLDSGTGALAEIYKLLPADDGWLPVLPLGSEIVDALPKTCYGFYQTFSAVDCPIVWDVSTLTEPGRYTISGTVSAPEGYRLKSGAGLETIRTTIAVYQDEPVAFFNIVDRGDTLYHGTVVLPKNSEPTSETLPFDALDLISPEGDWLRIPFEWDMTGFDSGTVGRYSIYAVPIMPPGTALLKPDARVEQVLYVMEEDTVDLGGYSINFNTVFCHWLMPIDPEQAVLELSMDGKQWVPITQAIPDYDYEISERRLNLDTSCLEIGKEYYFRLLYQNKSDGVLRLVISEFNVPIPDYEGDRDGGDTEGDTITPPLEQIPPPMPPDSNGTSDDSQDSQDSSKVPPPATSTSPPAKDSIPAIAPVQKPQEPTIPSEIVTRDTLTISGARLAWMLQEGAATIPFGWNGISLELPADFLAGLAVDPQQTLSLTLVKQSDDAFTVALSVADVPLADLPPTTVRFSCNREKSAPVLFLSEQRLDTAVRYENGCAVFLIEQAGLYRLAEDTSVTTPKPAPDPKPVEPAPVAVQPKAAPGDFLPVMGAALLCVGGAFLWVQRKRQ